MWLLVGLGNPGSQYENNRHNIGFMAVDEIVRRHKLPAFRATRYDALGVEGTIGSERVLVLKPTTFMNESGRAVGAILRFYKLGSDRVVVFHDELDLAPGKIRVKRGGGHGGHNGLRSIDAHIGPDYRRVRLGIGHPGDKSLVHRYVLGDFSKEEGKWVGPLVDACADATPLLFGKDENAFANRVTLLTNPPPPKADPKPKAPSLPDGTKDA